MNDRHTLPRARIFELIAQASPETISELVKKIDGSEKVQIIKPPKAMVIMSRARETVNNSVFNLGEVLVTEAEVALADSKGYMMVMGLNKPKALNGAILDAAIASEHPMSEDIIKSLLADAELRQQRQQKLWAAVKKTQVDFIGGQVEVFKPSDRSKDNR